MVGALPGSAGCVGTLIQVAGPIRISVVSATYRRPHLLARLAAAIEQQEGVGPVELVVVDDGSPDETMGELRRLASCSSVEIQAIRLPRNAGPATARNAGWRAARGPLIAFTDDDCVPQAGWLAALVSALVHADMAQGCTLPNPEQKANVGPFSRTIEVGQQNGWYQTCNIGYRRDLLEKLGGFDEAFPAAGEDTDLAWRALAAGARAVFVPDALVFHDIRPSRFAVSVRDTRRWRSIVLAVKKHPGLRTHLHRHYIWRASHPPAMLAGLGLVAAIAPRMGRTRRLACLLFVAPYIRFRTVRSPLAGGPRRRVAAIPFALIIDLSEVAVLARASARQGTLLL